MLEKPSEDYVKAYLGKQHPSDEDLKLFLQWLLVQYFAKNGHFRHCQAIFSDVATSTAITKKWSILFEHLRMQLFCWMPEKFDIVLCDEDFENIGINLSKLQDLNSVSDVFNDMQVDLWQLESAELMLAHPLLQMASYEAQKLQRDNKLDPGARELFANVGLRICEFFHSRKRHYIPDLVVFDQCREVLNKERLKAEKQRLQHTLMQDYVQCEVCHEWHKCDKKYGEDDHFECSDVGKKCIDNAHKPGNEYDQCAYSSAQDIGETFDHLMKWMPEYWRLKNAEQIAKTKELIQCFADHADRSNDGAQWFVFQGHTRFGKTFVIAMLLACNLIDFTARKTRKDHRVLVTTPMVSTVHDLAARLGVLLNEITDHLGMHPINITRHCTDSHPELKSECQVLVCCNPTAGLISQRLLNERKFYFSGGVFDECQHELSAPVFEMCNLSLKFRGLLVSATPPPGYENVLPIVKARLKESLHRMPSITVSRIKIDTERPESLKRNSLKRMSVQDCGDAIFKFICNIVEKFTTPGSGRRTLVVCPSIACCSVLSIGLGEKGMKVYMAHNNSDETPSVALDQFVKGEGVLVVCKMFLEATTLDIHTLVNLLNNTPNVNNNMVRRTIQLVGRLFDPPRDGSDPRDKRAEFVQVEFDGEDSQSPIAALEKQGEKSLGPPGYIGHHAKLHQLKFDESDFCGLRVLVERGDMRPIKSSAWKLKRGDNADHTLANGVFQQVTQLKVNTFVKSDK